MSRKWCLGILWPSLCAVAMSGCAGIQRVDLDGASSTTLEELRTDPGQVESAFKSGRAVVVRLRAGDQVPLKLALATPVISLQAGDNSLRVERDTYLYIAEGCFLVSPDGERWTAIHNMRGLKELFDLRGGSFRIGFGVNRQEGPFAQAELSSSGAQPSPSPPPREEPEAPAPTARESPPTAPPEPPTDEAEQQEIEAPAAP